MNKVGERGDGKKPKEARRPRILFISHSAGRTGAPIILLHFIQWLQCNSNVEIMILLREGGNLHFQFARIGKTWLLNNRWMSSLTRLLRRLCPRLLHVKLSPRPGKRSRLLQTLKNQKFDLVYSNTITNGEVLEWLEPLQIPVITHVHEMSHWIARCGQRNLELVKKNSNLYVAASNAVKRELCERWDISANMIEVVHEFIPTNTREPSEQVRDSIRRSLAVPANAFLVVGSGVETWRKGKDLFVDLALEANRQLPDNNFRFLWVGAWENRKHRKVFRARLLSEGLQSQVMFIGQVDNPLDYFCAADVFAMTSKEDPYPLVCLEAALMGLPVLCFEGAGGMPEFVEHDAGIVFPYLDVASMAKGIIELAKSPVERQKLGNAAKVKVKSRHDVAVGGRQLQQIIINCIRPA